MALIHQNTFLAVFGFLTKKLLPYMSYPVHKPCILETTKMLSLDKHPKSSRASKGQGEIIYKCLWHSLFLIDFVEIVG